MIRDAIYNALTPLVIRCLSTFHRHPATEPRPPKSRPRMDFSERPRGRFSNFLTRNTMTVFSSLGSSSTAIDPSEREAFLAAGGTNTASSMGVPYESAFWAEETYMDMSGNDRGDPFRPSTNGDLNA